ncbi:MAG: hypothetical protein HOG71_02480 [Bacteroidetes bacterium]|jgi:hypothetical protein|nr:hypothetical protein [Bacteroidota bacterium]MBT5989695.1 hypothetical protein [Bacteroidota bacterium]
MKIVLPLFTMSFLDEDNCWNAREIAWLYLKDIVDPSINQNIVDLVKSSIYFLEFQREKFLEELKSELIKTKVLCTYQGVYVELKIDLINEILKWIESEQKLIKDINKFNSVKILSLLPHLYKDKLICNEMYTEFPRLMNNDILYCNYKIAMWKIYSVIKYFADNSLITIPEYSLNEKNKTTINNPVIRSFIIQNFIVKKTKREPIEDQVLSNSISNSNKIENEKRFSSYMSFCNKIEKCIGQFID